MSEAASSDPFLLDEARGHVGVARVLEDFDGEERHSDGVLAIEGVSSGRSHPEWWALAFFHSVVFSLSSSSSVFHSSQA